MAHWDNVRKQYVDDTSDQEAVVYKGETDDQRKSRQEGASAARFQDVKGGGLGSLGERALRVKEQPQSTSVPAGGSTVRPGEGRASTTSLSGKDQLEAMRKRRASMTSGY